MSTISNPIPLSVPHLAGNEWTYVKECLDTNWVSSVGRFVDLFEQAIAQYTGAAYAVATMNGTSALHISLLLMGVESGDYIILPNITFVAPANTIRYLGADPLLIDVDPVTWQMDLDLLENFLETETTHRDGSCFTIKDSRRIKAVVPVHILGNIGDMDRLVAMMSKYNIDIVEDATEALGSQYKGRHAGTIGSLGCLSFNGNKIITTGGGGMIITNDASLARRAKHLTTQAKSDPVEYIHDEVGFNYRLVNVLAAIGLAQIEQLPRFLQRKKEIADFYRQHIGRFEDIRFQESLTGVAPNYWLFTISTNYKNEIWKQLTADNIQARPLWLPMNQLPMFDRTLYVTNHDHSNSLYDTCLSLPCSSGISDVELARVVGCIMKYIS